MNRATSNIFSLLIGISLLLAPSVAQAQGTAINDNDQKLYLNQSPPQSFGPFGEVPSRFYQPGGFYVTKGKVRLTVNELLHELDTVAPAFASRVREQVNYGSFLSNGMLTGLLVQLLALGMIRLETLNPASRSSSAVMTYTVIGLAAGAINLGFVGAKLTNPPKLPSADETASVLHQYNEKLVKAK